MRSHLSTMATWKVSDFLLREEGMVGNRSAFATAALVSTTALAMTLLVVPDAKAGWCPAGCQHPLWCCWDGHQNYFCRWEDDPDYTCWKM